MGQMIISEQDIVNAICIDQARKKYAQPEDVEVELMYDEDSGFSAEAYINGLRQGLQEMDIIGALRLWLGEFLNEDPYAGIQLVLDDTEGITAVINGS
ncbi:MAG TPA: DUF2653 domain-containing protein [Bacillus bacterium]|uniref:DUF2653 family protein n=2 Tax=Siminovitchia fordii TaxID=254759 RepID=A0ABQ4K6X1_9BACI|nr:DUF2653 family protein [Siminovitchia fordii]GIN21477.1 hypothetical protein J1TS3_26110 [Siminovitchia fordii]HBZ08851.1 DUF2653 domain-containing protein [Bacillus sp. (in: firmicutes)]